VHLTTLFLLPSINEEVFTLGVNKLLKVSVGGIINFFGEKINELHGTQIVEIDFFKGVFLFSG
jgi:hypothetical protein